MPKTKRRKKKDLGLNFYLLLITIVLLLSVINIEVYFYKLRASPTLPTKVLGAETNNDNELELWIQITKKNPWYLPAWIEIAKIAIDKNDIVLKDAAIENIKRIDPNNTFLKK